MLTGKTVVTRESDFDDYTRSRIFALMAAESRRCPRCHNFDTLVPLQDLENDDLWTASKSGQRYAVKQLRCVACALSDMVERDATRITKDLPNPPPGSPAPGDGRMFVVHPTTPPESGAPK